MISAPILLYCRKCAFLSNGTAANGIIPCDQKIPQESHNFAPFQGSSIGKEDGDIARRDRLEALLIQQQEEKNLLLKAALNAASVPPGEGQLTTMLDKLSLIEANQSELQALVTKKMTDKRDDEYSWVSFSELARLENSALDKRNARSTFRPIHLEEPILTQQEQRDLLNLPAGQTMATLKKSQKKAVKHESYLCMRMTKYLNKVFAIGGDVVVNSEEIKWIVTLTKHEDNFMKPDFFVIREGLHVLHEETGSEALRNFRKLAENRNTNYYFGSPANWILRDCITALVEFKVKQSPEDFGKLVCYLQHLCRGDDTNTFYGMVCDSEVFWLAACTAGKVDVRIDGKWTDEGSLKLLRNFFSKRNDWRVLLDYCLNSLSVKLVECSAFLGSGSYGRVFKVVDSEGAHYALKIVHSMDTMVIAAVQAEIGAMKTIRKRGGNCVAVLSSVHHFDEISGRLTGIGFLMKEVGECLTPEKCRNDNGILKSVFRALFKLHELRCYHGDARLANLIIHDGNLIWVDFMRSTYLSNVEANFDQYAKHDFNTLFTSVYGEKPTEEIQNLVEAYARTLKTEDFEALINAFIKF